MHFKPGKPDWKKLKDKNEKLIIDKCYLEVAKDLIVQKQS